MLEHIISHCSLVMIEKSNALTRDVRNVLLHAGQVLRATRDVVVSLLSVSMLDEVGSRVYLCPITEVPEMRYVGSYSNTHALENKT